jgi:uncharacterized small protein (DUF1192 family)
MTDELVRYLKGASRHPYMDNSCNLNVFKVAEAADRIEALTAEVERLRDVATNFASSLTVAENNLLHVNGENERLREELDRIAVETGRDFQTMWVTDMARAALEKQP